MDSEEGTAYFYKCKRCRIKFHEDYIVDKMCKPCLKLSNYVCDLCENGVCNPSYCANKWERCDECDNAYHEDRLIDGTCERCCD